ncbi:MAG: hypothetical protein MUC50_20040, partial [Myxococcota bacterium]|nr:hypothetical protein [Myxococcota bacterium]
MRTKFGCALVFLSVLVAGHPARATVPDLLPVQGLITDQAGKALDGNKDVVFSLYSKKEGGTALWKEQWTNDNAVVFEDGFFTVYLGSVTSLPIDNLLDSEKLWLGIQIAGDTEMERLELASVPFALEAEVCRQIGQLTEDKIQTKLIGPSGASAAGSCNGTDK